MKAANITWRILVSAILATLSVASFVLSPASAADVDLDRLGRWSTPFWEGGAEAYDPPSSEKARKYPTAASAIALPDGRLLYWNALEGSENGDLWVGSQDGTAVLENARARILDLGCVAPVQNGRAIKLIAGAGRPASEITEVVLVRVGANTHAMDADMRAVKLDHSTAGAAVLAQLPNGGDGRILPPGPYYVFVMRDTPKGPVPSVAQTVLIHPDGDGKVSVRSV